jgi:chromosome segregation ATPase
MVERDELSNAVNEKFSNMNNLNNNINLFSDKIQYLEKKLNEKDKTIESLKEEVEVLNSTIDEKDKTIEFLGMR